MKNEQGMDPTYEKRARQKARKSLTSEKSFFPHEDATEASEYAQPNIEKNL